MSGYTKLSSSLVTSTIWQESAATRVVWITMLAIANQHGEVAASVPGLAKLAGVTLAECEEALRVFSQPDRYSRTPDYDGRRIAPIEGGWELLNHQKYRHLYSADERREHTAARTRRWRARQSGDADVTLGDAPVTLGDARDGKQKQKQIQKQEEQLPCAADATPEAVPAKPDYRSEFEIVRLAYPKREGAQGWPVAEKRYIAWRKSGEPSGPILAGVHAYARLMEQTGKIGTPYVVQAQTFFGPQKRWTERYEFTPPPTSQDAQYAALAAEAGDVSGYLV